MIATLTKTRIAQRLSLLAMLFLAANNVYHPHTTIASSINDRLLTPILDFVIPTAAAANSYGGITIDGNLNDWGRQDRISIAANQPASLAREPDIYARWVNASEPVYVFGLKTTKLTIGENSTLYFNSDQNATTGLTNVFGADYFLNIFRDGQGNLSPNLYDKDLHWLTALEYAYAADKKTLEVVVPAKYFKVISVSKSINVYGDLNDNYFTPEFFAADNQYTLNTNTNDQPVRTDLSKRIGIVYSMASKNFFYGDMAYSQLYMALQHQAMMAGISFDLIHDTELTNLSKLINYDALIFPYAANIPVNTSEAVRSTLSKAVTKYGLGIIAADEFLVNDEANKALPGDPYQSMKALLGIARTNGAGPIPMEVLAGDVSHPAMKGYTANELIISYPTTFSSYYAPLAGQPATILAYLSSPTIGKVPGVIATTTGGRNVHFASSALIGDTSLAWQAIQWVIYGNEIPLALKMGRESNLFIARNDMDQSQFLYDMEQVDIPLYWTLLDWKNKYNFVGSYYINIGNDPANSKTTDWNISKPLFKKYLALDNEIGTHSWTHPADTNILTAQQLEYEFNQSMNEIGKQLNPTWRTYNVRGGAIPGQPEKFIIANTIIPYLSYLSGGWSAIGSGFPNAFGYLTPNTPPVYFAPNMTFDYTMMQYGVLPRNQFGVPTSTAATAITKLTAAQAQSFWRDEIDMLMRHTSQPIILWPWHDYGPTTGAIPGSDLCDFVLTNGGKSCYSVAMFENTLAYAKQKNSEFATLADIAQRIDSLRKARMNVVATGNNLNTRVSGQNLGTFSLAPSLPNGKVIQKVENWYAYNNEKVFLPEDGGEFNIQLGSKADNVTRIASLPLRARLIKLMGDGDNLSFSFQGEGNVSVNLSPSAISYPTRVSDGKYTTAGNTRTFNFSDFGTHTVNIGTSTLSGEFTLKASSLHSRQCLSVEKNSLTAGSRVITQACNNANAQNLIFAPVSDKISVYTIKFAHSQLCLDVSGANTANGAQLAQYGCNMALHQQFKVSFASSGSFLLTALHSNKPIGALDGNVIQWSFLDRNEQKWLLDTP